MKTRAMASCNQDGFHRHDFLQTIALLEGVPKLRKFSWALIDGYRESIDGLSHVGR